jgi:hypothetical protein
MQTAQNAVGDGLMYGFLEKQREDGRHFSNLKIISSSVVFVKIILRDFLAFGKGVILKTEEVTSG